MGIIITLFLEVIYILKAFSNSKTPCSHGKQRHKLLDLWKLTVHGNTTSSNSCLSVPQAFLDYGYLNSHNCHTESNQEKTPYTWPTFPVFWESVKLGIANLSEL